MGATSIARWFVRLAAAALMLGGMGTGWCVGQAVRLDVPIIFTQLPIDAEHVGQSGADGGMARQDYGAGGRIVRLAPDDSLQVLSAGFESACGADVSFDGKRVLFAGRRTATDKWAIWEMDADGGNPRQVTHCGGNCRNPAYQATLYTIVSTEPWYQIMFVSDAAGELNEGGGGPAWSLYSCRLDGSELRRLTMNLGDDQDPYLMSDGRVLLASRQRMDLRRGVDGRVALFGVNTDGADYALYCDNGGRRIKHMPCETADGLVVFVEAERVDWDGAGQLGAVRRRRPMHSYRSLTSDERVLYHSPAPLDDGAILVSRRSVDGSTTHGVYRFDPENGQASLIYDDPAYHELHARMLKPRPRPDGRSSVVNEKYATGRLYCLNAYLTDAERWPRIEPGVIKRLRVIEGVPPSVATPDSPSGIPAITPRRLLGVVPVEEDGSFNIELPADIPVQLQTLDENGLALRSCGWIWVKHREPRGCIGCHEDPELTPENRFVQAVRRPSMKLTLPARQRRAVTFEREVQPIVSRKCVACHGAGAELDLRAERGGDAYSQAYRSLLVGVAEARRDEPAVGRYVWPGQARTSSLIWRLLGRNASRPWDGTFAPRQEVSRCPPAGAEPLTAEETQVFIEWIDLGALWCGPETAADTVREGNEVGR